MGEISGQQQTYAQLQTELEQKKIMFMERKDKYEGDQEAYRNKIEDFKEKVDKQERENTKLTQRINQKREEQE